MIYQFGDCIFDSIRDEFHRSGEVINMGPQALAVLRYLLEHRDRVVSRDELFEQCWPNSYVSDTALTSCLKRLRQTIGQTRRGPTVIATRHRRGYQFVAEVTALAATISVRPEVPLGTPSTIEQEDAFAQIDEHESPPAPLPSAPVSATEHRHLTVLSCALLEVERLTHQLDLEDAYDLMQTFRATVFAIVAQYDGYVAQYVDHRVLVYFGYPQAHEDAAQRAVRSGLALVEARRRVAPAELVGKGSVAVGVGIDSGLVIISSDVGEAGPQALAMGSPLRGASRLSELARPGTVVISEATAQLVDGYFDCKLLRDARLTSQLGLQAAYEVLGESSLQTRIDVGMARGLTPFVGRETELALLLDRWTYAQEGMGQMVIMRGEAGIGKSRMLQVLKDHVVEDHPLPIECRCSPYHQHTAFHPMIDLLQRALKAFPASSKEVDIETLEAFLRPYPLPLGESAPLLAALLSLPIPEGRYPHLNLSPQGQRERTLDVLVTLLVAQSSASPVLFIIEDLHWSDPSTLEFFERLMGQAPTTSILVVASCRPTFEAPWSEPMWLTSVTLNRLTRPQIHEMMTQVTGGKAFSAAVAEQLADRTDGVPLFVEELIRMVLETGQFEETDVGYDLVGELSELSIPLTLHDSLMSRLDRLGPDKEIAQWGAVIGREFTYELIQKATSRDEVGLKAGLGRLVASEFVFQRGVGEQAAYRFKHALVQDVAYRSLRRRLRQERHQRIGQVLLEQFPETAEAQPELLAYHYTEAGKDEVAVTYWQRASQHALERSANPEAIAYLTQGLALLKRLPATPARLQQELDLQVALGPALIATKGYAGREVERAYDRAWELCQQMGDTPQLIPALRGLGIYYRGRGDLQTAFQLAERLLRLAQTQPDPAQLMLPHFQLGLFLFYWGEPVAAQLHHRQVLAIYDPQAHRDLDARFANLGVVSRSFLAWELWCLGYPDQAVQHSQAACALAQEVSHPFSLTLALFFTAFLRHWRRDLSAVHEQAVVITTLATEHGFEFWAAYGVVLQGWTLVMQGQGEQGIAKMRQGLDTSLDTGSELWSVYFLGLLAEAYGAGGHPEEGLNTLAEAIAVMETKEVSFYMAELSRLKGLLLLKQAIPDASQAEVCFHRALDIARQQEAKSWELRAAISLARLWRHQGKCSEAHELLSSVYDWFTEGFGSGDLQDAKTLLGELAETIASID